MENVEVKYWYLREHKLFRTLSNSDINKLCIITRYKTAGKGEFIYLGHEGTSRIYFLKKGMIRVSERNGDKETTKDIIQKGDLFGALDLNGIDGTASEFAQVISDKVVICSFLAADFENVLASDPRLALSYTKLVGLKFKKLSNKYSNLVFKDAKTRLHDFIHQWALEEGIDEGSHYRLHNYLTQQDIASIVCTTRQTVAELISEMEHLGQLTYNRKEILVKK